MRIHIDQDDYTYSEPDDLYANSSVPLIYMPLVVEAARSLTALRKKWDSMLEADPLLQYASGAYPLAVVLEIEGVPMGVVRMVDDTFQYIEFTQEKQKVELTSISTADPERLQAELP